MELFWLGSVNAASINNTTVPGFLNNYGIGVSLGFLVSGLGFRVPEIDLKLTFGNFQAPIIPRNPYVRQVPITFSTCFSSSFSILPCVYPYITPIVTFIYP